MGCDFIERTIGRPWLSLKLQVSSGPTPAWRCSRQKYQHPGGKMLSSSRAWPLGQEDTTPLTPGCELCHALPCSQLTQTETGPGIHFALRRLSCQSLGCRYLGCGQLPFICPAGKTVVMIGGLRLEIAYLSFLYSKLLFSFQNLPKALFLWKTSLTSDFSQSLPPLLLMDTWV